MKVRLLLEQYKKKKKNWCGFFDPRKSRDLVDFLPENAHGRRSVESLTHFPHKTRVVRSVLCVVLAWGVLYEGTNCDTSLPVLG